METKNEELLYSLPDYISGKLNDKELRVKIEEEIGCNAEFRNEYELMKETYSSIKGLEFFQPPEHYFTNLVPRINKRIENGAKPLFSGIFRLANLFKYALPALSVIVLIFIFTFSNKSSKDNNIFVHTDDTINRIMNNKKDTLKSEERKDDAVLTEEKSYTENTSENTSLKVIREKVTRTQNKAESEKTGSNNINIDALLSETEETYQYDDYVYETDFNKLSGKEQTELINKLSNTKF